MLNSNSSFICESILGSCRGQEMCDLRMPNLKEEGSMLVVNIRPLKTSKRRKFVIVDGDDGISYLQLFKKYLSLRPSNVNTDRVFLKYKSDKCIRHVVGTDAFGKCPLVTRFLNLPEPDKYTGHAFRRTSAAIIATGEMDADTLKRQGSWKSSTVAASYIELQIVP